MRSLRRGQPATDNASREVVDRSKQSVESGYVNPLPDGLHGSAFRTPPEARSRPRAAQAMRERNDWQRREYVEYRRPSPYGGAQRYSLDKLGGIGLFRGRHGIAVEDQPGSF